MGEQIHKLILVSSCHDACEARQPAPYIKHNARLRGIQNIVIQLPKNVPLRWRFSQPAMANKRLIFDKTFRIKQVRNGIITQVFIQPASVDHVHAVYPSLRPRIVTHSNLQGRQ